MRWVGVGEAYGERGYGGIPMTVDDGGVPMAGSHFWGLFDRWMCCRVCGIVRRADGNNKPCKGPTRMRPMESVGKSPDCASSPKGTE
jgi:hypothetical protein